VLVIPITFIRCYLRCCFVDVLLLRSTGFSLGYFSCSNVDPGEGMKQPKDVQ
jgi:hypothetical protein